MLANFRYAYTRSISGPEQCFRILESLSSEDSPTTNQSIVTTIIETILGLK